MVYTYRKSIFEKLTLAILTSSQREVKNKYFFCVLGAVD